MLLNKELFEKIGAEARKDVRLRKAFDLRDSEEENGQRMLNILIPGTKTAIHRHQLTSEVVICIYGSALERIYDDNGNELEKIVIQAGSDTPGLVIDKGLYHSLEATEEMGVVCTIKAGEYVPMEPEDCL